VLRFDFKRTLTTSAFGWKDQFTSAMKWRAAAVLGAAMVLSVAGGYWFGYTNGAATGAIMGLRADGVLAQFGFADALAWEEIIANNPVISASLSVCRKGAAPQNSRAACQLPIWVEPAKAPL
jgi:hypothetical protein